MNGIVLCLFAPRLLPQSRPMSVISLSQPFRFQSYLSRNTQPNQSYTMPHCVLLVLPRFPSMCLSPPPPPCMLVIAGVSLFKSRVYLVEFIEFLLSQFQAAKKSTGEKLREMFMCVLGNSKGESILSTPGIKGGGYGDERPDVQLGILCRCARPALSLFSVS
jgi:hypothetical protein